MPPWRLALVTVMQFAEDLSDRRADDAPGLGRSGMVLGQDLESGSAVFGACGVPARDSIGAMCLGHTADGVSRLRSQR
jgi:hypothetical protein